MQNTASFLFPQNRLHTPILQNGRFCLTITLERARIKPRFFENPIFRKEGKDERFQMVSRIFHGIIGASAYFLRN
jgi:hypothetical protein